SEHVLVGITVGTVQRARWDFKLEPLQQSFVLRMIGKAVEHNRERLVGQSLDHVAIFQVILAIAVRREPPRSDVMDSITGNEWIIEDLRYLVAESDDIQSVRAAKNTRADPTGVIEDEESQQVVVAGVARLKVEGVETDNAAVACISNEQEGVGEQEGGDVL